MTDDIDRATGRACKLRGRNARKETPKDVRDEITDDYAKWCEIIKGMSSKRELR